MPGKYLLWELTVSHMVTYSPFSFPKSKLYSIYKWIGQISLSVQSRVSKKGLQGPFYILAIFINEKVKITTEIIIKNYSLRGFKCILPKEVIDYFSKIVRPIKIYLLKQYIMQKFGYDNLQNILFLHYISSIFIL